jgi:hypothetical protein
MGLRLQVESYEVKKVAAKLVINGLSPKYTEIHAWRLQDGKDIFANVVFDGIEYVCT